MVLNTQSYMWDGLDGYLLGPTLRAPYGANNILNIPTRPCNDALEINSYKYRNRNVATEFPNTLAGDQQGV